MKFLSLVAAALSLAPAVLGAPLLNERQTTPVEAITNSVNILQSTASQGESAIAGAVQNAENNVSAAITIAASVKANLDAIVQGLEAAAASIVSAVASAADGIAAQAAALTQSEIDGLVADLITLEQVLEGISATVFVEITNLEPAAQAAVSSEVTFVLAAIAPVVNPVMIFADAVLNVQAKAGATVTGVQGAYNGVEAIVERMAATNGLPGVAFPGYPA